MILHKQKYINNSWQKWFAWFPVLTEYDELVWLETIERKPYDNPFSLINYLYRRIK